MYHRKPSSISGRVPSSKVNKSSDSDSNRPPDLISNSDSSSDDEGKKQKPKTSTVKVDLDVKPLIPSFKEWKVEFEKSMSSDLTVLARVLNESDYFSLYEEFLSVIQNEEWDSDLEVDSSNLFVSERVFERYADGSIAVFAADGEESKRSKEVLL